MSLPKRVQLYLEGLLRTMERDEADVTITPAQRVKLRGYMAVVRGVVRVLKEARRDRIRRIVHEGRREEYPGRIVPTEESEENNE